MLSVSQTAWEFLATSRSVSFIRKQYLENKYGLNTDCELICMCVFARVSHCDKPMRLKVGKSTGNT